MTVLDDVIPVLVKMIETKRTGTVHLVNPGPMTHNEILQLYKTIVDGTLNWRNVGEQEMNNILLAKRSSCVLDVSRVASDFPNVPTLANSITRIFTKWTSSS
jgi:hypothetical protein